MDRGELDIPEATEVSWRNNLADFDTEVWPWFQEKGYTKDAAFTCWVLNRMNNDISELVEVVRELIEEIR